MWKITAMGKALLLTAFVLIGMTFVPQQAFSAGPPGTLCNALVGAAPGGPTVRITGTIPLVDLGGGFFGNRFANAVCFSNTIGGTIAPGVGAVGGLNANNCQKQKPPIAPTEVAAKNGAGADAGNGHVWMEWPNFCAFSGDTVQIIVGCPAGCVAGKVKQETVFQAAPAPCVANVCTTDPL